MWSGDRLWRFSLGIGQRKAIAYEILHLITLWKATKEEIRLYKKNRKSGKPVCPEAIARLAERGKDISDFFKRHGRMVRPTSRVVHRARPPRSAR